MNAGVATLAILTRNCDFLEEGSRASLSKLVAPEKGDRTTTAVKSVFLSKRDELFGEGTQCLGFAKSGADLPVLDEARCEITQGALRGVALSRWSLTVLLRCLIER